MCFNKYKKDESLSNNVVELNLTPRDYQLESAKIGLEKGSGIIIVDINLPNSSTTIQYEIKYKFKITKTYPTPVMPSMTRVNSKSMRSAI